MAGRFTRRQTLSRRVAPLLIVPLAAIGVIATRSGGHHPKAPDGPPCVATVGDQSFGFDLDQAQNATTSAAVGRREGMPDHAVTVALATALQESRLRNLDYGDLDSRGLFQQRPSQGWGSARQVTDPGYAASSFYRHLAQVKGWQAMEVTRAAQAVQRSAAPDAYAQWEPQAHLLAEVLTGEVPAGFACRITLPEHAAPDPQTTALMTSELGSTAAGAPPSNAAGWTAAAWLVAHADQHHVASVTYAGQQWTAQTGKWSPSPGATETSGAPVIG
jgi:hypothetical protein